MTKKFVFSLYSYKELYKEFCIISEFECTLKDFLETAVKHSEKFEQVIGTDWMERTVINYVKGEVVFPETDSDFKQYEKYM